MDNKISFITLFKKVLFLTSMSRPAISVITVLFLIIIVSCDRNRLYDESLAVSDQAWHMDSALVYSVEVEDTLLPHKFYINIRHNQEYRYSNIFLFIDTRFPNGNTTRDTIECLLADKQGNWFGKGPGKIKDNSILIHEGIRFPRKGEYKFRIIHGMRETKLEGIEDIGIRFEKMN